MLHNIDYNCPMQLCRIAFGHQLFRIEMETNMKIFK